jgi:type II secretory pathway pseudopilin PulG
MIRFLGIVSLLIVFAFLLSCQTYTTGLQQSVARAEETSAIAALKTISTAQQTYAISNGGAYGTFQQLCEGGFLDQRFNSSAPQIKDYVFSMDTSANSFSVNADPARAGDQAGRHLYMDSTSPLIRVNPTQPATAKDPLMQP